MLILHLSDIHLRKSEFQTAQDPNFHLRNELVRDVRDMCAQLGVPDVIIVSGDVAFAGETEEFIFATDWLFGDLCAACGAARESIFVVPGNHDVLRETADRPLVQLMHREIKDSGDPGPVIAGHLTDPEAGRMLYESINNYNDFALQFYCDLSPPDRTRAKRDLLLNDGSTLRLWGLNTAIVSSSHDLPGDLFYDPACLQITRHDGVTNLVVAHHHLSWLRQARELEDHLNDVAPVQIFGHVHTNRIEMSRDYMRLTASAAHPDRHEQGWEPGYNLVELSVENKQDKRTLQLKAHVRVWQTAPGGFQAKMDKASPVFKHSIELERWRPTATGVCVAETLGGSLDPVVGIDGMPAEGGNAMTTLRNLGLRFYRLSFSKKAEIAGRLQLLENEDIGQPDYERFRRVFIRAHERGKLEALADAIRAAEQG